MKRLQALVRPFFLLSLFLGLSEQATALVSKGGGKNKVTPSKILVTGASGRTGQLVFEALLRNPGFEPKALVRSERSADKLRKAVPNVGLDQIIVCDVTSLLKDEAPPEGLDGIEAIVICTSAVPRVSKLSLAKALIGAPFNLIRRKKAINFRSFRFVWKGGQYPEKVDYEGQCAQVDLAKKLGMKLVVVVGSMGGTDPSNFLNDVGKNKDGSGNGDILIWKRKGEKYLVDSGLDYTIIHPGGLIDTPPGEEEYVLDVNDVLLENKKRSISRADVANLCVAALRVGIGQKVALDVVTRPPQEGVKIRSAERALTDFIQSGKVYDYSL